MLPIRWTPPRGLLRPMARSMATDADATAAGAAGGSSPRNGTDTALSLRYGTPTRRGIMVVRVQQNAACCLSPRSSLPLCPASQARPVVILVPLLAVPGDLRYGCNRSSWTLSPEFETAEPFSPPVRHCKYLVYSRVPARQRTPGQRYTAHSSSVPRAQEHQNMGHSTSQWCTHGPHADRRDPMWEGIRVIHGVNRGAALPAAHIAT